MSRDFVRRKVTGQIESTSVRILLGVNHARHCLNHVVVHRFVSHRPVAAITTDRRVNQGRVAFHAFIGVKSDACYFSGTHVLDHHVRFISELPQDFLAEGLSTVNRNCPLSSIGVVEVRRHFIVSLPSSSSEIRSRGWFHFDDVGPKVRQQHCCERT